MFYYKKKGNHGHSKYFIRLICMHIITTIPGPLNAHIVKIKEKKKITFIMPSASSKIFSVVKSRSLFELQTINVFSIKEREEKQRSLHAKIYSRDE